MGALLRHLMVFEDTLWFAVLSIFFHILLQILVPESQVSPVAEELVSSKEKHNSQKEFAKPQKHIENSTQGDRKNSQPEVNAVSKQLSI